ncbi:MAG: hypothetical protein Q9226_006115 [Calogaya cf. arnoldii]
MRIPFYYRPVPNRELRQDSANIDRPRRGQGVINERASVGGNQPTRYRRRRIVSRGYITPVDRRPIAMETDATDAYRQEDGQQSPEGPAREKEETGVEQHDELHSGTEARPPRDIRREVRYINRHNHAAQMASEAELYKHPNGHWPGYARAMIPYYEDEMDTHGYDNTADGMARESSSDVTFQRELLQEETDLNWLDHTAQNEEEVDMDAYQSDDSGEVPPYTNESDADELDHIAQNEGDIGVDAYSSEYLGEVTIYPDRTAAEGHDDPANQASRRHLKRRIEALEETNADKPNQMAQKRRKVEMSSFVLRSRSDADRSVASGRHLPLPVSRDAAHYYDVDTRPELRPSYVPTGAPTGPQLNHPDRPECFQGLFRVNWGPLICNCCA